ncbi:acetyl-CoA carboxylase carboxyl transferase subunit alpha, partial [Listeria monocytogenes]|nr:acetyl-CoA carboxylase carboxyl transferase subunit alpha [Listeria monocytogenes]
MANEMEFEKPILELKSKIADLKEYNETSDVDLTNEIEKLEKRLAK